MNFLPRLIAALALAETNGDAGAVGDNGRSVGCLQIGPACIADVNTEYGTAYHWPESARDPAQAREICRLYLLRWCRLVQNCGPQDAARIWNGGPTGYLKQATIPYWRRVERIFNSMKSTRDLSAAAFADRRAGAIA